MDSRTNAFQSEHGARDNRSVCNYLCPVFRRRNARKAKKYRRSRATLSFNTTLKNRAIPPWPRFHPRTSDLTFRDIFVGQMRQTDIHPFSLSLSLFLSRVIGEIRVLTRMETRRKNRRADRQPGVFVAGREFARATSSRENSRMHGKER